MNWHFCIVSTEKRALDLCRGSMNEGEGWGCGVEIFLNTHSGDRLRAPKTGVGARENHTYSGDGWGDGWKGFDGDGASEKSWEQN